MSIVERESRGKKVFMCQVRVKGHPHESRTFPSRKLAQKWFDERSAELKYGHENLATLKCTPSLKELNDRYGVLFRISSWEANVIAVLVKLPICLKPISSITELDILGLKTLYLETKKVKPQTFQKYLRILRRPIKKARSKWGYKGLVDPFEDIGVKATDKPRERVMTDAEYWLIQHYLDTTKIGNRKGELSKRHFKLLIDFALETAMRCGEIANVQTHHIKEDYTALYIPKTKTNVPRTIPLSPKAQDILRELAKVGHVFPVTSKAIGKRWACMLKRIGIVGLHFHDLRHTALSRYDRRGFSKGELKLIGGHKTDKMLFRYLHADLDDTVAKMRMTCPA